VQSHSINQDMHSTALSSHKYPLSNFFFLKKILASWDSNSDLCNTGAALLNKLNLEQANWELVIKLVHNIPEENEDDMINIRISRNKRWSSLRLFLILRFQSMKFIYSRFQIFSHNLINMSLTHPS